MRSRRALLLLSLLSCAPAAPIVDGARCDSSHGCDATSVCRCGYCVVLDDGQVPFWDQQHAQLQRVDGGGTLSSTNGGATIDAVGGDGGVAFLQVSQHLAADAGVLRGSFDVNKSPGSDQPLIRVADGDNNMLLEVSVASVMGRVSLSSSAGDGGVAGMVGLNQTWNVELGWVGQTIAWLEVGDGGEACAPFSASNALLDARIGIFDASSSSWSLKMFDFAAYNPAPFHEPK